MEALEEVIYGGIRPFFQYLDAAWQENTFFWIHSVDEQKIIWYDLYLHLYTIKA